ncbi:hypothetical protein AAL_03165 [Moelleriella libera RCEF 2490]|uniref:CID domain-containing protein n=1 Tax=Moelleriella libera RCEF 2490 TaxID=1081109 RepID=A0A168EC34_9HYPO|nr:hypothetical protein AAL_03165 [Moelleriella libera RCEF 2490]
MASPELAIAKAAFSASLFRADPASISRPSVDAFFQLLNSTLTQCSRPNVQNCKDYILSNIVYSTGRTTSLAKYLVALSKSQTDDSARSRPSGKRRRLHILYLVNDVLHHVVQKQVNQREFSAAWDPYLPSLFSCAASFDNCPKHSKKLEDLIDLWQERNYVADDLVPKLKEALTSGAVSTTPPRAGTDSSLKLAKDAPYVLPSFHGDAGTPWYDLPAASWLPHLVPNSFKPMLPDLIRPIQLAAGPASKALTDAVKALLCDADRIFSRDKKPNDDPHVEINELGERIVLDEMTGSQRRQTRPKRTLGLAVAFSNPVAFSFSETKLLTVSESGSAAQHVAVPIIQTTSRLTVPKQSKQKLLAQQITKSRP